MCMFTLSCTSEADSDVGGEGGSFGGGGGGRSIPTLKILFPWGTFVNLVYRIYP